MQKYINPLTSRIIAFSFFFFLAEGIAAPTKTAGPVSTVVAEKEDTSASTFSLSSGGPLSISSKIMTLKGPEDKVFFEGSVRIRKGDLTITAGRAEVFLSNAEPHPDQKPDAASSVREEKEITRIELMDNIDLTQGDRRVIAQKGVYNAQQGAIVLTGKAEMWEKGYHVRGKVITLSLTQKRSFIEGSQLTID